MDISVSIAGGGLVLIALLVFAAASIGGGLVAYLQSTRVGWRAFGMSAFAGGIGVLLLLMLALPVSTDGEPPEPGISQEIAVTPTVTPSHTPGLPPETLLSEELDGVKVQLEYQPVAYVFATTPEEYRETKAALEERLPSLVPDPCSVRWSAPVLQIGLERDDVRTSGCQ